MSNSAWGGRRSGAGRRRQYIKIPATFHTERSERQPLTPESDLTICLAEADGRTGIMLGDIWYGDAEALAIAEFIDTHLK
jgi:hypothetical protein